MKARVEKYESGSLFEVVVFEEDGPDGDAYRGLFSIASMLRHVRDTGYTSVSFTPEAIESISEYIEDINSEIIKLRSDLSQWVAFGEKIKNVMDAVKEMEE